MHIYVYMLYAYILYIYKTYIIFFPYSMASLPFSIGYRYLSSPFSSSMAELLPMKVPFEADYFFTWLSKIMLMVQSPLCCKASTTLDFSRNLGPHTWNILEPIRLKYLSSMEYSQSHVVNLNSKKPHGIYSPLNFFSPLVLQLHIYSSFQFCFVC